MTGLGHGFHSVDAAPSASPFAEYLRTVSGVEAVAAGKRDRDRLLGLEPDGRALEVGCGLGNDARRLFASVGERGSVVGLDASAAMLERARAGAPEVEWVLGDAHELPFPNASFDAARVERTLQHVADPERVVAEMQRVTRPRGVVLACEPDWATVSLSTKRQDLADVIRAAAESAVRHPRLGRALPALLADAGLVEVQVAAEALVVRDFALLNALADLPTLTAQIVESDGASQTELDGLVNELEHDAARGRLLGAVTLVTTWGLASG